MVTTRRPGPSRWWHVVAAHAQLAVAVVLVAGLFFPLAGLLLRQPRAGRVELRQRWDARAANTAMFITAWVDDVAQREASQATRLLAGADVTEGAFEALTASFGFQASVLLDDAGRLVHVVPHMPEIIGRDMTTEYAHLRTAAHGQVGVSGVVRSAAQGVPVVAVAVPFAGPVGRRVFSGAYQVGAGPIGAYLRSASSLAGSRFWIVDRSGFVVASSGALGSDAYRRLREVDPALAGAAVAAGHGEYTDHGERRYFTHAMVKGAPWEVVTSVPTGVLYGPVNGVTAINWLTIAALAVTGAAAIALVVRLTRSERLLATVSRTDSLTGVANRRALEEHLGRMVSQARRHHHPLTVLMVDVDHFKHINDTAGHETGDVVLRAVAHRLSAAARTEDVVGRWGGEEFLVIAPVTATDEAVTLAERIRAAVRAEMGLPAGVRAPTVSIGVAGLQPGDHIDTLVARADGALYQAKLNGRDRVIVAAGLQQAGV